MTVQRSRFAVLAGITLFGGLIAAPALAESTQPTHDRAVQHLTCVQDTQGLMCTIDEASNSSATAQVTAPAPSQVVTSQPLEQLYKLLIGLIYLGFPVGLVLAVLLRDKQDKAFVARLDQLERVWNQPSQSE